MRRRRPTDAERRASAEAHNANRAAGRACAASCGHCRAEKAHRSLARRTERNDAGPLDRGDGTATLWAVKEAAGVRHGGFLDRPVTAAPFGGTPEERRAAVDDAAETRRDRTRREEDVERATVLRLPGPEGLFACNTERCLECGAPAVALCDGRRTDEKGTCDAGMCAAHRNPAGENRDLCFLCVPQRPYRGRRGGR